MDPLTGNRYALAAGNPVSSVEVDGPRPADVGPAAAPPYGPESGSPRLADAGLASPPLKNPEAWDEMVTGARPHGQARAREVTAAREGIEPFLEHPEPTVRREAKRALAKIDRAAKSNR